MSQDGEIDLLIATDCISEGQNLQDCDYLINYDIHWNPVRIIQRFGRIDRIGSPNNAIQLVNFWPTPDLNKYINLKNRVEARMALVDIAATAEDNILQTEDLEDLIKQDMRYRDKQLLRLKDEVLDLEEGPDAGRAEQLAQSSMGARIEVVVVPVPPDQQGQPVASRRVVRHASRRAGCHLTGRPAPPAPPGAGALHRVGPRGPARPDRARQDRCWRRGDSSPSSTRLVRRNLDCRPY